MAGSGWDPAGIDAEVTISPDGQTATRSGDSTYSAVRGLAGRMRGRRYFEVTPATAPFDGYCMAGFMSADASLVEELGKGTPIAGGWKPAQGAFIYSYPSGSGTREEQGTVGAGVLGVLIDFDTKVCTIYRDGVVDWVESMEIPNDTTLYPAASLYRDTSITLQTVEPFQYPPEVTFMAWDIPDSTLISRVAGLMKIEGEPARRTLKAFSFERLTFQLDGALITESKPLGQTVSNDSGEYQIILRDGFPREVFVVAFDDYGESFRRGLSVTPGYRVHPTAPNGHIYECNGSGVLPESEPAWIIDTENSQLIGTASFLTVPLYRPEVHGPLLPVVSSGAFLPTVLGEEFGGGYYIGDVMVSGGADAGAYAVIMGGVDSQLSLQWKTVETNTNNSNSETNGFSNTQAQITAGSTQHPAAQHCTSYGGGGFDDWYLPAGSELYLAYKNREHLDSLIIDPNGYWSSTQTGVTTALAIGLGSGGRNTTAGKAGHIRTRPVRRIRMFSPADIETELWLDAADPLTITLTSGRVSSWADKSGKGRDATQSTASRRPTHDADSWSVIFDGSTGLSVPSFNMNEGTFYFVSESYGDNGYRQTVSRRGGSNWTNLWRYHPPKLENGSPYAFMSASNSQVIVMPAGTDLPRELSVVAGVYDLSEGAAYVRFNGEEAGRAATAGNLKSSSALWGIGCATPDTGSANPYDFLYGSIREVLFVPNPTGVENLLKMEGYLAWKWGLTDKLPENHPYKFVRP